MPRRVFIRLSPSCIAPVRPCSTVQELVSVPVVLHALTDQVARSAALSSSLTAPAHPALTAAAFVAGALPEGAGESTRM